MNITARALRTEDPRPDPAQPTKPLDPPPPKPMPNPQVRYARRLDIT